MFKDRFFAKLGKFSVKENEQPLCERPLVETHTQQQTSRRGITGPIMLMPLMCRKIRPLPGSTRLSPRQQSSDY